MEEVEGSNPLIVQKSDNLGVGQASRSQVLFRELPISQRCSIPDANKQIHG